MKTTSRVTRASAALACGIAVLGATSASASAPAVFTGLSGPVPRWSRGLPLHGYGLPTTGEGAVWALSWSKWTLLKFHL